MMSAMRPQASGVKNSSSNACSAASAICERWIDACQAISAATVPMLRRGEILLRERHGRGQLVDCVLHFCELVLARLTAGAQDLRGGKLGSGS